MHSTNRWTTKTQNDNPSTVRENDAERDSSWEMKLDHLPEQDGVHQHQAEVEDDEKSLCPPVDQ